MRPRRTSVTFPMTEKLPAIVPTMRQGLHPLVRGTVETAEKTLPLSSERDPNGVMKIVRPDRIHTPASFFGGCQNRRFITFIFGNREPSTAVDRRRNFGEKMTSRTVFHRMRRIE